MKNNELISGVSCTIRQLFSGDRRIVIPDMQREYCWPSTINEINNKDLVTNFVSDVIDKAESGLEQKMGLIYAYQSPKDHIQLCDGQQRITTLYLLVGVLAAKLKPKTEAWGKAVDILISDFELKKDDHEPRLHYAIRESTLMFLRDAVYNYFGVGNKEPETGDIHSAEWYFGEYTQDPSIINIIKSIGIIEGLVVGHDAEKVLDFVTERISFLYYDMSDRRHGEDQFVVINTTGKSLTKSESRKPNILGKLQEADKIKKYSDIWENWEQFFWDNRTEQEKGDSSFIVDNDLEEFFRWVYIIEIVLKKDKTKEEIQDVANGGVFDVSEIEESPISLLDKLELYFQAFKRIPEKFHLQKKGQMDYFKFLPVLLYSKNNSSVDERYIIRCANYFATKAKDDNISKTPKEYLPASILFISYLNDENEIDIANICAHINYDSRFINEEDKVKFEIYLNTENRDAVENMFWEEEAHPIFNGEILTLLKWSRINKNENVSSKNFSLSKFDSIATKFNKVFDEGRKNIGYATDTLRRALLSKHPKNYPCETSFGYGEDEWKSIICTNEQVIGDILERVNLDDVENSLKEQISTEKGYKFEEFVTSPYLLMYCDKKHIIWNREQGWQLIKTRGWGQPFSVENEHLFQYLSTIEVGENWTIRRYINSFSCVHIQNSVSNIVFDIRYCCPSEQCPKPIWNIVLFRRDRQDIDKCFKEPLDETKWERNEASYIHNLIYSLDKQSNFKEIEDIIKNVISICINQE